MSIPPVAISAFIPKAAKLPSSKPPVGEPSLSLCMAASTFHYYCISFLCDGDPISAAAAPPSTSTPIFYTYSNQPIISISQRKAAISTLRTHTYFMLIYETFICYILLAQFSKFNNFI
uniref:Uncharacterized protein n=1 Tax=Bactrocera dorsalis TaxID=27457 RepID=A0A034VK33_BACDO